MIQMKWTVDYEVFRARMGALYNKVIPRMRVSQRKIARWALDTVKIHTPKQHDGSTTIRDFWVMDGPAADSRDRVVEFVIHNLYPNPDVIRFFEEGTKPHEIRPKTAKFLHFTTYEGDEIFTKLVHHPGTPAYLMVLQTRSELLVKIEQYIQETFAMIDQLLAEAATRASR